MRLAPSRSLAAVIGCYLVGALVVGIQQGVIIHENTFAIFRASYGHLVHGLDLYAAYPREHRDLYKYSPTFALLMAPFAWLPFAPALVLWNVASAGLLCVAIARLLPGGAAATALAVAFLETVGALQYSQTNTAIAALLIAAFLALEVDRPARAGAWLALGAAVKIFPLTGILLAVPRRWTVRTVLAAGLVLAVLAALPLLVTDPHTLLAQYRAWHAITAGETASGEVARGAHAWGLNGGAMQAVRVWFGVDWPNWPVQLLGTALLVLPALIGRRLWSDSSFRIGLLASILMYVVLFNHRAEAPSYVIAMAGVGIWYATSDRRAARTALVLVAIVVVSLASSELVPHAIRRDVVERYAFKTAPILLVWLVLQFELLSRIRRAGDDHVPAAPAEPTEAVRADGRLAPAPLAHG
jgi:hypothetical protein